MLIPLLLLLAPATQPAAPLATERVVENAALRFHFAVPKAWKEVPQDAQAVVYVFQLPAVGEARRSTPTLILTAREANATAADPLADEVDGRRKAIVARNPDAKFAEDAAAPVANHDGWVFVYDTTLKQKVTSNGKTHEEQITVKVRDQLVVIEGRTFEFVLNSDEKGLGIRSKLVDRVGATLVVAK